jgi:[ribosomal protein S5]-alanine N-acetyltransferase
MSMLAQGTFTQGRPVALETERLKLRSLSPVDASERWLAWVKDPELMHPINMPARRMTRQELANQIASHDNYHRFLIGVFDKASAIQIGYFFVDVVRPHETATFNVVIGEKDWWGKGVVNEARAALLDHFFDKLGMRKACGGPLSRNFPSIFNYKAQGWIHEATLRGHFRSVVDGSRVDQLLFRLFADEWRTVRNRVRGR